LHVCDPVCDLHDPTLATCIMKFWPLPQISGMPEAEVHIKETKHSV